MRASRAAVVPARGFASAKKARAAGSATLEQGRVRRTAVVDDRYCASASVGRCGAVGDSGVSFFVAGVETAAAVFGSRASRRATKAAMPACCGSYHTPLVLGRTSERTGIGECHRFGVQSQERLSLEQSTCRESLRRSRPSNSPSQLNLAALLLAWRSVVVSENRQFVSGH